MTKFWLGLSLVSLALVLGVLGYINVIWSVWFPIGLVIGFFGILFTLAGYGEMQDAAEAKKHLRLQIDLLEDYSDVVIDTIPSPELEPELYSEAAN